MKAQMKLIVTLTIWSFAFLPGFVAAATITFDGGGDTTTWGDADNWDGDVVPSTGDDVIIPDGFEVTGDQANYAETITIEGYSTLAGYLSERSYNAGTFILNDDSSLYGGTFTATSGFIFNDNSNNSADTIIGDSVFNGASYNNGNVVTGDITLNTTYYSGVAPTGGIFVLDDRGWIGAVSGTIYGSDSQPITQFRFEGGSRNSGTVPVDAVFDTSLYTASGGVLTVSGTEYYSGNVLGIMYGADLVPITSVVFEDDAENSGTVGVDSIFNDSSANQQFVTSAVFNDFSSNLGSAEGDILFNDSSLNQVSASGTVAFTGSAVNDRALVYGTVSFSDDSHNAGNIEGDVTFAGNSYTRTHTSDGDGDYSGTITGTASFLDSSHMMSGEIIGTMLLGGIRAFSSAYTAGDIDTVNFSDTSYNDDVVPGNAVFTDDSYNSGTVNGNADVYIPSPKPIGGTVLGTVTYHGYPDDPVVEEEVHTSRRPSGNRNRQSRVTTSDAIKTKLFSKVVVRDLEVGVMGEDVRSLQKFLNANGFVVASVGPGSAGNETDYFGEKTRSALARWQMSNGVAPAAGYFGPRTRLVMGALAF